MCMCAFGHHHHVDKQTLCQTVELEHHVADDVVACRFLSERKLPFATLKPLKRLLEAEFLLNDITCCCSQQLPSRG